MIQLTQIICIFLCFLLLISGCVSNENESNQLNQSSSINFSHPTQTAIPQSLPKIGAPTASRISQNIDWYSPIVQNYAKNHITDSNKGNFSINQVLDIWDSTNQNWHYIGYPDEYIYYSNASDLISGNLAGNCLNFATVISATVEAIGGRSRVVKGLMPNRTWHAYSEVFIGNSPSEVEPIIEYVNERYSLKDAWGHEEVNSNGITEYWLNLDNWDKKPGYPRFDDNGEYWVYYPDGSFKRNSDSGYSENFPQRPISPNSSKHIVIYQISETLPYNTTKLYPLPCLPKEKCILEISSKDSIVNAYIFDDEFIKKIHELVQKNSTSSIVWEAPNAQYFNVKYRVFEFNTPSERNTYLVISNLSNINSKFSVSINIINSSVSQ